jgi:hypothetical protein
MLLNTLLDELTGRGSGTEAARRERYDWLEQLRCANPQAAEGGPMAGIPGHHWYRLPQALGVAGQRTDLLVGTLNAQYLVFAGRHAARGRTGPAVRRQQPHRPPGRPRCAAGRL